MAGAAPGPAPATARHPGEARRCRRAGERQGSQGSTAVMELLAVACVVGLFVGPPVVAALLARWATSPSADDRRRGFPIVPLAQRPPPLPPASPDTAAPADVAAVEVKPKDPR